MKIFERILDKRIRNIAKVTSNQCGLVRGCGTTDAIHAARILFEKHREKNVCLHAAFIDLEKAFDRVPHELIWYALRQHDVPEALINLVKLLYKDTKSKVVTAAGTTEDFSIKVGVHQGSALSPLLFILVMDTLTNDLQTPTPWTLLYADDVMIAATTKQELQNRLEQWNARLTQFGLRINLKKTEYLSTDKTENGTIRVDNVDLPRTNSFKYLGSSIADDGSINKDIAARINCAWHKWKTTTAVLCDPKIGDRLKSKSTDV
ncbi:unnamed protein product [Caenorhabditis auriculariae]|uniref:Reverse transcriptase domain-containing protein n=1 Tax=Caenorhabditis auriculariae TaxID=2777116 RepID=A0A8S1GZ49_9PELO|nr:unnamed protein product [Caenorhabditis auriculariae]